MSDMTALMWALLAFVVVLIVELAVLWYFVFRE